jgi:hypothetical protein
VVSTERNLYGEVHSEADLKEVYRSIRREVERAHSRPALTQLYKRAGYLVTLARTLAWQEKLGSKTLSLRALCQEEFGVTARNINRRAREIGVRDDYDEAWGR